MNAARRNRWILLAILALALYARIDVYRTWQAHSPHASLEGVPLPLNPDAYFYLGLARDLMQGTYSEIDPLRGVPHGTPRPSPPPLLSLATWGLAAATPASLHGVAIYLPALLSLLLAWPVYGLTRRFASPEASLVAVGVALFSPGYLFRTSAGRYDTDALNVTLVCCLSFLLLRFAVEEGARRYRWFGAAGVACAIGLWWWDQAQAVVILAALVPLATALAFFYRASGREAAFFAVCGLALALGLWLVAGGEIAASFRANLGFLMGPSEFPSIRAAVSELKGATLGQMLEHGTGSVFGMLAAYAGLGFMLRDGRREMLFLAFPLAVAILTVTAIRFSIFLAPIVAIPVAVLLDRLWQLRARHRALGAVAVLVAAVVFWPALRFFRGEFREVPAQTSYPMLASLAKDLPADAVVWGHWAMAYPIQYFAKRTVVSDASILDGRQLFALNHPQATSDPRLAANFMRFYVERGDAGLRAVCEAFESNWSRCVEALDGVFAAGPGAEFDGFPGADAGRWRSRLFPSQTRPIFLLLDLRQLSTAWFYNGSWDFERRRGADFVFEPFVGVTPVPAGYEGEGVSIDRRRGSVETPQRRLELRELRIVQRVRSDSAGVHVEREVETWETNARGVAAIFEPGRLGVAMEGPVADSVASRLFFELDYDPRYFRPVRIQHPEAVLFEVLPDTGESGSGAPG